MYNYSQEIEEYRHLKGKAKLSFQESMIQNRVHELSYYLSESPSKVREKMNQFCKLTKKMWESKDPKTDDQILDFYKQSDTYVYELLMNECEPGKIDQMVKMMDLVIAYRPKNVLVYGSGVASEVLIIQETAPDIEVSMADVVSLHHKFAYYRIMQRDLIVKPIAIKSNTYGSELMQDYDLIVCFDTIEHVADPEKCISNLYDHLNQEGFLLLVVMFNKNSGKILSKLNTHPLHIEKNKQGVQLKGAHWKSYLRQLGFSCEGGWNQYGQQWIKVLRRIS